MRSLAVAILALLVAGAALVPLASDVAADHVYTHRYVIQGRVVDDSGAPVSGARVDVKLAGWAPSDEGVEGICPQERSGQQTSPDRSEYAAQTSPAGDFRFCIHAHQIRSGAGSVEVTVGNTTVRGDKDTDRRTTYFHVEIPTGDAGTPGNVEQFGAQVVFRGRVWQMIDGRQPIEGIQATGIALVNRNVNATLALADGQELQADGVTSQYGEFSVTFNTDADLTDATITARVGNFDAQTFPVQPPFRALYQDFVIEEELDLANDSPPVGVLGVLLAAMVAVAGVSSVRLLRR